MIPGIVAGGMRNKRKPTSWNAAFNANSTISDAGRVSTISSSPGGNVQSIFGAATGRWYFEVTGISGTWACGIARSDVAAAENSFVSANAIVIYSNNVYQYDVSIGSVTGYGETATYGIEILCGTGQVWIHCSDGESNVTVGPFTLPSLETGQTYRAMMQVGGWGTVSAILNAGHDPFVFGLPSGCEPIFGGY